MKVVLIVAMVAFASATPAIKEQWTSFKRQHGKTYQSAEEEQFRMSVFSETLKLIEEHNAKYEAGLSTYYLAMNHFGDMLPEEVIQSGFNRTKDMWPQPGFTFVPPANVELPRSVDWRQKGAVTAVKNQGSCGACWAFSSTGAIEGQLFRKTGKLVSLSEQQLMDCSTHFGNKGCNGGLMQYAFEYLESVAGLEKEDTYPYKGSSGWFTSCKYQKDKVVEGTQVKAYTEIRQYNDDDLLAAVATVGPVSIAVSANNRHFMQYGGGVFNGDTCDPTALDHGILLVGYTSGSDGSWIVKNSWGTSWGEKGYMRLSRSRKNICGISTQACYPVLK